MEVGAGALEQLPRILHSLACERPFIISDTTMLQLGVIKRVCSILSTLSTPCDLLNDVFTEVMPEPTEDSLAPAIERIIAGQYDCLVAIGGGSSLDTAKAVSVLAKFGGVMRDYITPRNVTETGLPLIAIPTTAGTGSEVTRFTIITDATTDEKMLCMGTGFMPSAAIVDYELTMSVPPRITADTGIDALTHAIEAYVSKKANPYSDSQALASIELIAPNILDAYFQPQNTDARAAMMLGSTLAGVAFSNASVALVHGMSRPIGAHFHVPHGLSNAMLLPTVTEYSIPNAVQRYATCARVMGAASSNDSDDEANKKLVARLQSFNKQMDVLSPAKFGIDKKLYLDSLELMANQALASGSPANNPRVPSQADIVNLYRDIWT